jgi:hypothetical protein
MCLKGRIIRGFFKIRVFNNSGQKLKEKNIVVKQGFCFTFKFYF